VYRCLDLGADPGKPATAVYDWLAGGGELPLHACRNDLEPTVVAGWPIVARRLSALRAPAPLLAMVSGSGGTVFAVYQSEERARAESERVEQFRPIVAPLLGRAQSALRPRAVEGE
jgi:4-diphosphocytidyl-2C-methyl-D-erythritol kinase